MSLAAQIVHTLCEVWAGLNVGFTATLLVGLLFLRRRFVRARAALQPAEADRETWPAIAILRPCEGREPGLHENLLSSLTAPYPGPREVLFLVPSQDDPAHAIAHDVQMQARALQVGSDARVLVTSPPALCNRKAFQLAAALSATQAPIVVSADSDVRLARDDLPALLAPLCGSLPTNAQTVGASFAAPIEVAPQTAWDRAGAALVCASAQSFLALYGLYALRPATPAGKAHTAPMMAGALCAMPRAALEQIGGFSAFFDCLGEDNEIARRLCALGYRISVSPRAARCFDGGRSAREVIERAARWQTVVRAQRPALWPTYPLMLGVTPALVLLALLWPSTVLGGFVALLFVLRALLAHALLRLQGLPAGPLRSTVAFLQGEGLLWLGFVRSAISRRITWRGHPFHIERGGRLRPATDVG
ncbi:MAG: glycosyltransferase [Myxococcales bacterium]|nr:glycosyltransferase [Myxococcales bacterium]